MRCSGVACDVSKLASDVAVDENDSLWLKLMTDFDGDEAVSSLAGVAG